MKRTRNDGRVAAVAESVNYRVKIDRMRKAISRLCGVAVALLLLCGGLEIGPSPARTYYIAPDGSDTNPGTEAHPWQTFYKAGTELTAGDTAIFADGTYNETRPTEIAHNGGQASPIIFRAKNKHKAIIVYTNLSGVWGKLHITGTNIVVKDFEITQNIRGTTADDVLVFCHLLSENCTITGNKIHNAFEECVKAYQSNYVQINNNICFDTNHEGFDVANSLDVTIKNNTIYNVGRTAIITKAGARSVKVFNNEVRVSISMVEGIILGDQSTQDIAFDRSGYEAYSAFAWNNLVVADTIGSIERGIVIYGCRDCGVFNNIVVGAKVGLTITKSSDLAYGWTWDPLPRNPVVKNNIVVDCQAAATNYKSEDIEGTLVSDYNLYWNCPTPPTEPHSRYSDPLFVEKPHDFHLQAASPARGTGDPTSASGFLEEPINVACDKAGDHRSLPWDMGLYGAGEPCLFKTWVPLLSRLGIIPRLAVSSLH